MNGGRINGPLNFKRTQWTWGLGYGNQSEGAVIGRQPNHLSIRQLTVALGCAGQGSPGMSPAARHRRRWAQTEGTVTFCFWEGKSGG